MKLLLDACVWGRTREPLQAAGHDVVWAGDWSEDPGDEEMLAVACEQGRVLVTLDKDFGELAVVRGIAHCGILRLVNWRAKYQAVVCLRVLAEHEKELQEGCLITAEPGRLRIRPPGQ